MPVLAGRVVPSKDDRAMVRVMATRVERTTTTTPEARARATVVRWTGAKLSAVALEAMASWRRSS